MNGKDYMQTQITMIQLGKKIQTLDLDAFLKCISNAHSMAPMLDPTRYRKACDNLRAVEGLAKAFKEVKTAMQNTQEAILRTTLAYMTDDPNAPKPQDHDPQGSEGSEG